MKPQDGPRRLDLASWERHQQYELFRSYDWPWFNVTVDVDVEAVAARCAAPGGPSFFLASLWLSLVAANEVRELRLRLRGDEVVEHRLIHGGSTVLMPDDSFVFAYFDFLPEFEPFAERAAAELERVRGGPGKLEPRPERDDLIHYSVLPWIAFTSFQHARRLGQDDSVPRLVFGRRREVAGRRRMPVSVEVHHALADGLHVSRFYQRFEELMAQPDRLG